MAWSLFKRTTLSDRHERALDEALESVAAARRNRFRVLACIDGSESSFDTVRFAARIARGPDCDIIVAIIRPIDQGLWSGGLQVRVARQNMMDAGLELPELRHLRTALDILAEEGLDVAEWGREADHRDAWGDPLGDNKVEYRSADGQTVVLKMKTAPDPAAGILDQYELGPYNLIIIGEPSRWRRQWRTLVNAGVVQKITLLAPCSVLITRQSLDNSGVLLTTDGSARSMQAIRRSAVLAHSMEQPITLFAAVAEKSELPQAEEWLKRAHDLLEAIGIEVAGQITAVGDPAEEIVKAGADYKLIMVSDEGRSWLQRISRGSIAHEVVRQASVSVLDVR